jgi:hypothetical protein
MFRLQAAHGRGLHSGGNTSERLLYTLAFVAWPSMNTLSVSRPHLHGGMMSMTKMPGFTAEFAVKHQFATRVSTVISTL